MIHPLATTARCKFAVAPLVAKGKINKYIEGTYYESVAIDLFSLPTSFLIAQHTHVLTHRQHDPVSSRSVSNEVVSVARGLGTVHLEDTASFFKGTTQRRRWELACSLSVLYIVCILFLIPVNSLHSGHDFGSCLSLSVILVLYQEFPSPPLAETICPGPRSVPRAVNKAPTFSSHPEDSWSGPERRKAWEQEVRRESRGGMGSRPPSHVLGTCVFPSVS